MPNQTWVEVWRTRTTSTWYEANQLQEGVNYGCWFYPLLKPLTRGTGIFINTGRTLAFRNRAQASRFFANQKQCAEGEAHCYSSDALWATRAHALGIDTVQLQSGADNMPELIATTHGCLSQPKPLGTCPPEDVPLRTGDDAALACNCSESSVLLNCHGSATTVDRTHVDER